MTPIDLDEIERLALAAKTSMWWTDAFGDNPRDDSYTVGTTRADESLIAAVNPTAVLALVAEVRRLRKVEAAARDVVATAYDYHGPDPSVIREELDALKAALTGDGGGT